MKLRPHQIECIDSIRTALKNFKRVVIKAPCAFGKTIVFCEIAKMFLEKSSHKKAVIVVDNVEIVKQTVSKISWFLSRDQVGIYCASLKSKDLSKPITVGTLQSLESAVMAFDLVIIDECHDSLERSKKFCVKSPSAVVIGFTATPYDAKGISIYGPFKFFEGLAYSCKVQALIDQKLLAPMKYGAEKSETKINLSKLKLTNGEFRDKELVALYDMNLDKVNKQIEDMVLRLGGRKKVLISCVGIKHAEYVAQSLDNAVVYHSKLDLREKMQIIESFKTSSARFLVGILALNKGLDIPELEAIVNMRPMRSKCGYVQLAGRGVRISEGKKDCVFLDYGQTVENLGFYENIEEVNRQKPKTTIAPEFYPKKCPECFALVMPQTRVCECGHKFFFDNLTNTSEEAFSTDGFKAPKVIHSKVIGLEVVQFSPTQTRYIVKIKNPNDIPREAKGSRFNVYFYVNHTIPWLRFLGQRIKSKVKEGRILVWELNKNGYPSFIDCVEEPNGNSSNASV